MTSVIAQCEPYLGHESQRLVRLRIEIESQRERTLEYVCATEEKRAWKTQFPD